MDMKLINLRQERAELWEKAKAFLNGKERDGVLTADDEAIYGKMEKELTARAKEIERLENLRDIEDDLKKPLDTYIVKERPDNYSYANDRFEGARGSNEYREAFLDMARGRSSRSYTNTLQEGIDTSGGFLVPLEFERRLINMLAERNVIRKLATIVKTSGDRSIPVVQNHGVAAFVSEAGEIPESNEVFAQVVLGAYKIATMLGVTIELLSDAGFNLEAYLADEFGRRIGACEEEAFITGTGTGEPTGLLNAASDLPLVNAGAPNIITFDDVLDLIYAIKQPYRTKAAFIANDATIKTIRRLKDSTGQYLWQPSTQTGNPDRIFGYPIYTSPFMPAEGAGNVPLVFGDFSYYWIGDRDTLTFRRLEELYARNGVVAFLAYKRVDGKLVLKEALAGLKQPAA
jgi:HK97 family phage major capsid protein